MVYIRCRSLLVCPILKDLSADVTQSVCFLLAIWQHLYWKAQNCWAHVYTLPSATTHTHTQLQFRWSNRPRFMWLLAEFEQHNHEHALSPNVLSDWPIEHVVVVVVVVVVWMCGGSCRSDEGRRRRRADAEPPCGHHWNHDAHFLFRF